MFGIDQIAVPTNLNTFLESLSIWKLRSQLVPVTITLARQKLHFAITWVSITPLILNLHIYIDLTLKMQLC